MNKSNSVLNYRSLKLKTHYKEEKFLLFTFVTSESYLITFVECYCDKVGEYLYYSFWCGSKIQTTQLDQFICHLQEMQTKEINFCERWAG